MQLYLVQHGQAKAENEDPERPLTDQGAEDVANVARWAVEWLGLRTARVVHSGKTRARWTADVWGALLGADVEQRDSLAPNDNPDAWVERLDAQVDDLMLVGHLPHLDRLAGSLLAADPDCSLVTFQPGGLVALERNADQWTVSTVVPPRGHHPGAT